MIAFRYALRNVAMKVADKSFTAEGVEFPAGSFVIATAGGPGGRTRRRREVRSDRCGVDGAAGGGDA